MPFDNPTLNYFVLYVPVLVALLVAMWATYVKVYSVPIDRYKELLEREKKATDRAEKAEATNNALALLHEQLVSERRRGDELRELLRTATQTANQAARVAERAQQMVTGGEGAS